MVISILVGVLIFAGLCYGYRDVIVEDDHTGPRGSSPAAKSYTTLVLCAIFSYFCGYIVHCGAWYFFVMAFGIIAGVVLLFWGFRQVMIRLCTSE